MVDTRDLKSLALIRRVGSSPTSRTILRLKYCIEKLQMAGHFSSYEW